MAASVAIPSASTVPRSSGAEWSLLQLLKPEVLEDPYPFYARLRAFEPVHWDAFTHSWVVTSYAECVTVLTKYSANRTPSLERLEEMGLGAMEPYVQLMLRQLMFLDAPKHSHLRALCAAAFTNRRVEALREEMQGIAESLLDAVMARGEIELIGEFAAPLPGRVMAALFGIPAEDAARLRELTTSLSELVGNFGHDPDGVRSSIASLQQLQAYLGRHVAAQTVSPREGLIASLLAAEVDGARLTEDEVIANLVLVLAGGLEETTNLIGSGMLTLLRRPAALALLRERPELAGSAVEELLRYESPTQHTGRIAPEDTVLGGMTIRKGETLNLIVAAANRDPLRFDDPETLDLERADNRHLAFGWGAHYCLGSPLARMMAQVAFPTLLRRLPGLALTSERPVWRKNMGIHGLERIRLSFARPEAG